ncbi:MAG: TM2 domain-containing protein [Lachnospiraceae bacterium]|nr:TM2 domain-containing protein [Lachnospiraceae bacterium]
MTVGECPNCGGDYGPDEIVCSYCGAPIKREPEGYTGISQQSYQTSNGGTQVIQNIYVTGGNSTNIPIGTPLTNLNVNMGNTNTGEISRSRLVAGILAIVFGWAGVQFFYLNKIGLGIACVVLCTTGIPALFGLIQGICILKMSDADFENKYHVRAM